MQQIFDFLSENPVLAIFICLAAGYAIGFIRVKAFTVGATIGTLLVGFLLSRLAVFDVPGILMTVFLLLFSFTIGYEAGPAFFESLRSNGIKFVLHAVIFAACAFLVLFGVAKSGILDRDALVGVAAGALTQTSILTVVSDLGDMASVAYAVTYMTGTLLPILFITLLAPKLCRTSPIMAAKQKITKLRASHATADPTENVRLAPIIPRAYCIEEGAAYVGGTVEMLEATFSHGLEVVKCFRRGREIALTQDLVLAVGDVLTVISTAKNMIVLDDEYMREVSDEAYLSLTITTREIIITEDADIPLIKIMNNHGLLLHSAVTRKGKRLRDFGGVTPSRGMVIKVSGVDSAIAKVADEYGYVREIGNVTDVPFVFAAMAIAIVFGALKFFGFGLGDSTCALIIGLVCGWFCNKNPKYGKFPESTRWFLKSVGLNIFIAAKALTTNAFAFDKTVLVILGVGALVTLLPHIVTLFVCKYLLRMDDADNLGGLCGSGTITPALNGLIDAAGSPVFTASYATTNAVANILLTLLGVFIVAIM